MCPRPWRRVGAAAVTRHVIVVLTLHGVIVVTTIIVIIIITGRDEKSDNRDESHNSRNISGIDNDFYFTFSFSLGRTKTRRTPSKCIHI